MTGLAQQIDRAAYAATQGARVAWYAAHYALARRISGPFDRPGEAPFRPKAPPPKWTEIRKAFLELFEKDRLNIEAGLYPPPREFNPRALPRALENSRRFFADLPEVDRRRMERDGIEARETPGAQKYPSYYTQNFHYQSGGWLTEDSAKLYDTQVEVLFTGAADVMRRIALGALSKVLAGHDQRVLRHVDLACGTGRFLSQTLDAFPRLNAYALDLSPTYTDEARRRLKRWRKAEVVVGSVEAIPFDDGHFDTATCVYLFHELPPKVRVAALKEMARVIKPGGALVLADSLQTGDAPHMDQMLEYFPVGFHEPFYGSWMTTDLAALADEAGFDVEASDLAFLTKVVTLRRR
jgi:ubiquinone/menaquinone biosynthesis C-methylase UbiE